MIYGKPLFNPDTGQFSSLELHMDRAGASDFLRLLNRALNTADSQFNEDWIQLSDKLAEALANPGHPKTL